MTSWSEATITVVYLCSRRIANTALHQNFAIASPSR
jgi:hypothetical protein